MKTVEEILEFLKQECREALDDREWRYAEGFNATYKFITGKNIGE
ncbi:hypothetical protein vBBceHLY2_00089 [Bacillus phage vB_BceH_LY2]|nr:hypothetical protein vBBceHLY2_00089 [Bacillus phage vB_BceH_LY2]